MTVAELFDTRLGRAPHPGDSVRVGRRRACGASREGRSRFVTVGLQLGSEEEAKPRCGSGRLAWP